MAVNESLQSTLSGQDSANVLHLKRNRGAISGIGEMRDIGDVNDPRLGTSVPIVPGVLYSSPSAPVSLVREEAQTPAGRLAARLAVAVDQARGSREGASTSPVGVRPRRGEGGADIDVGFPGQRTARQTQVYGSVPTSSPDSGRWTVQRDVSDERPSGTKSDVTVRGMSRMEYKRQRDRRSGQAGFGEQLDRPGPSREDARSAERADALLSRILSRRSGVVRDSEIDDYNAYASALLGEEPISAGKAHDPDAETGDFTSEDPTELRSKPKSGQDLSPFFTMESPGYVPRRGSSGRTKTEEYAPGRFRPVAIAVNPGTVVETVVQNPRRNSDGFTGESDNTASFQREKQVTLGALASEVNNAARTPVMTGDAFKQAIEAGRARWALPEERTGTLVGYIRPPGARDEVPVFWPKDREGGGRMKTGVDRPDPSDWLDSVQEVEEPLLRVGNPYSRDASAIRGRWLMNEDGTQSWQASELAQRLGVNPEGTVGPAPMLSDVNERRRFEAAGGPMLHEFMHELTAGGFMADPDIGPGLTPIARALLNEGLEVMDRSPGARPGAKTYEPISGGDIFAAYSNVRPGEEPPAVTAAKQWRAFAQEAPRPLTMAEAVSAAVQIGSRWGVGGDEVLRLAAAKVPEMGTGPGGTRMETGRLIPENDPGRPLMAPGSQAAEILRNKVAEMSRGREVDLFSEAGIGTNRGEYRGAMSSEADLLAFLRAARSAEGGAAEGEALADALAGVNASDFGDQLPENERFGGSEGGFSVRRAPVEVIDPLDRLAVALTGDIAQGLYLADVARRSSAPGRYSGSNVFGTTVGPLQELSARSPVSTLLELVGRRTPVTSIPGAQQLRRQYQNDFSSTSGRGQPVTGQSGYARMAEGLGGQPGLPQNEKAMALLAQRIRDRSAGDGQPAVDPSEAYRAQKLAEFGGVSPRERYLGGGPLADYLGHGSAPGSWMHDRAMGMSTQRIQQRVQAAAEDQAATDMASAVPQKAAMVTPKQSMFNSPAPAPTPQDAEAMDRQAAMQRLQQRREGFAGPRTGRIIRNFGNVG